MPPKPTPNDVEQLPSDHPPEDAEEQLLLPGLERSLTELIPRSGQGLALSASDIALYLTCPLQYKFARILAIPRKQTINQRFGILIHHVLERFHAPGSQLGLGEAPVEGDLQRLRQLFDSSWERSGFGSSDDELQLRDLAIPALTRYCKRHRQSQASPIWLERGFDFAIGRHRIRGRVDRVDRLPDGEYELIDYKTGRPKTDEDLENDIQLPLYRLAARVAWDLDAKLQSYYYVLDDQKIPLAGSASDAERVEATVNEVAAGIESEQFEPTPSVKTCRGCAYRTICPASMA